MTGMGGLASLMLLTCLMDINRMGTLGILSDYRNYNERLTASLERLSTGERAASPGSDPILWGDVQQLRQLAGTLAGFSDNLNRGAASVRIALNSMELARQHILQLEEKLNAAYAAPPGSAERAENLREYNELHQYVNDAAKAPDAGARRLLDDPASYIEAGNVEIRAGEGGFSLLLRSQEIHTGATGLDIPLAGDPRPSELAADPLAPPTIADIDNATNAEIGEMLAYIEYAKADLTAKSKALAVDAAAIEDSQGFNEALIRRNNSQADEINVPDLNTEAVLVNSIIAKNQLALQGLAGLKDTYRLALQLIQ